ncbi:MAG TPA: hypothetical protein VLT36_07975 [Candidatus Dormibacteraeota bacterium]|nr:hypothetical protein [Candidatus Dormibacteraeota bacterium]
MSLVLLVISLLIMGAVCIGAWDAFVNGKLYFCTDGGSSMDFIFVGDWVHRPESVSHVIPRPMDQPDEIKRGWTIRGLWCLWCAFVSGSVLVSAFFSGLVWRTISPNKPPALEAGTDDSLQLGESEARRQ